MMHFHCERLLREPFDPSPPLECEQGSLQMSSAAAPASTGSNIKTASPRRSCGPSKPCNLYNPACRRLPDDVLLVAAAAQGLGHAVPACGWLSSRRQRLGCRDVHTFNKHGVDSLCAYCAVWCGSELVTRNRDAGAHVQGENATMHQSCHCRSMLSA